MEKGEQTKQRIIAQAAPVFNQRGFAGTSLSDLMEATGLQKGGIYRHFSGKEELALAAFDHAIQVARKLRFDHLEPTQGAVERLKQFVTNFTHRRSPVPGGCPIWNTAIDSDDGNPALRERAKAALTSWVSRLAEIAREGKKRGEIHSEVDPEQLAMLLICSLEGALTACRLLGDITPLLTVESHLHSVLDGVANQPDEKRRSPARKSKARPSE